MINEQYLDRVELWTERVLDDIERLPEELTDDELREREAAWYADFYTLEDGWLVADPDDPAMRRWLTEDEGMSSDLADQVLAKMRELAAARSVA